MQQAHKLPLVVTAGSQNVSCLYTGDMELCNKTTPHHYKDILAQNFGPKTKRVGVCYRPILRLLLCCIYRMHSMGKKMAAISVHDRLAF